MHDCGKIGVPDNILNKPAKLTDDEYKQIQEHTIKGFSILKNFTAIPNLKDGAYYHHERYDGKGYPTGIVGENIPLCARIICVADSYDAMSSTRSYRKHLSQEETIHELEINSNKQFDPKVIPVIISMITDGFTKKIQSKVPYLNK